MNGHCITANLTYIALVNCLPVDEIFGTSIFYSSSTCTPTIKACTIQNINEARSIWIYTTRLVIIVLVVKRYTITLSHLIKALTSAFTQDWTWNKNAYENLACKTPLGSPKGSTSDFIKRIMATKSIRYIGWLILNAPTIVLKQEHFLKFSWTFWV